MGLQQRETGSARQQDRRAKESSNLARMTTSLVKPLGVTANQDGRGFGRVVKECGNSKDE